MLRVCKRRVVKRPLTVKLKVERAVSRSLSNSIGVLTGSYRRSGGWIRIALSDPPTRVYPIVGHSFYREYCPDLGYRGWDEEVENLDAWDDEAEEWGWHSDAFDCFGISEHVRWEDVHFYPDRIEAPSLWRIVEALAHVKFVGWDRSDI